MSEFDSIINYLGYESSNLYNFTISSFNREYKNNNVYLNKYSKEELKEIVKEFYRYFFSVNNVYTISKSNIHKNVADIGKIDNEKDFYKKIDSILEIKSPFDIDIKYNDSYELCGNIHKPMIYKDEFISSDNRKVYFSYIDLSKNINDLTLCCYSHEICHTQLESNIGYSKDYLNKEVITMFIEKLMALYLNPDLLNKVSFIREKSSYNYFLKLKGKLCYEEKINALMYIKSYLLSNELFKTFLSDKRHDKYIYDIQNIFNGNITVDDYLDKYGIEKKIVLK